MQQLKTFTLSGDVEHSIGVIFNSPHSGSIYPDFFLRDSALSIWELRSSEDAFVGDLFDSATDHKALLLQAIHSRSLVDLNRSPLELDPSLISGYYHYENTPKNLAGLGVIPRISSLGNKIYPNKLNHKKAMDLLDTYYFPFQNELSKLVSQTYENHGFSILFDCHSMPSSFRVRNTMQYKINDADIVLGDLNGKSCDPSLTHLVKELFEDYGFAVRLNQPFAGGYITKRFGNPAKNYHSLQIEINRGLYMDEKIMEPNTNFNSFKSQISKILEAICSRASSCNLFEIAAE